MAKASKTCTATDILLDPRLMDQTALGPGPCDTVAGRVVDYPLRCDPCSSPAVKDQRFGAG